MGLVGALVGALGIAGVVAGLAFKDRFGNYLPRLLLGLHPQFQPGDLIEVDNLEGRVIRVSPLTVLLTVNGEELRIPNTLLYRQTIINYSHRRERRLHFSLPLSPTADLDGAEDAGTDALRSIHGALVIHRRSCELGRSVPRRWRSTTLHGSIRTSATTARSRAAKSVR